MFRPLSVALFFCAVGHITGPILAAGVSTENPEDLVQVLAGTDALNGHEASTGNTLPQIKTPWGFNDWAPSTNHNNDAFFFRRRDGVFRGLRCTHQPSPWIGDYGHFLLEPHIQDKPQEFIWSPESDKNVIRPYRFKAEFERIEFDFVPTSHAGILQMKFPKDAKAAHLSLTVQDGQISVSHLDGLIRGRSSSNSGGVPYDWEGMYFTLQALSGIQAVNERTRWRGTFTFELNDDPILVAVGTSFISQAQADFNLQQEVGSKSFKDVLTESRKAWNQQLGRVRAEAIDDDQLSVFYTNLWKSMLFPRYLQEVDPDGKVVHSSPYTGEVLAGNLVTDSGFWDSYLTVYHLQSIVFPENLGKTVDGWVQSFKEAHWLPQWASPGQHDSMVGTMGDIVLADAIAKSEWGVLSGFDVDVAYEAIRKDAFDKPEGLYGRAALPEYLELGYVPAEVEMSVSRTLNYYTSDAAIARAAKILGKDEDAEMLEFRSMRYGTIFNNESGFFEPKDKMGSFLEGYNPRSWGSGFTEAGAWQYRFSVPHDVDGLKKLYDGRLCAAVREMMSQTEGKVFNGGFTEEYHEIVEGNKIQADFGLYAHNNQPVHQVLYVAKKAGCNAVADSSLRKVMSKLYTKRGWPGDEDNGEMAAWYVLSALGIFALEGAKDEIILGSPALSSASVQLPKNKLLTITAENQDADNVHVQSVTWTPEAGSPRKITDNVMKYTEVMRGGARNMLKSTAEKEVVAEAARLLRTAEALARSASVLLSVSKDSKDSKGDAKVGGGANPSGSPAGGLTKSARRRLRKKGVAGVQGDVKMAPGQWEGGGSSGGPAFTPQVLQDLHGMLSQTLSAPSASGGGDDGTLCFPVGSKVKIQGLASRKDLNGKVGSVLFRNMTAPADGRIPVKLDETNEEIKILSKNLSMISAGFVWPSAA